MSEARPHRPARSDAERAAWLEEQAHEGRLHRDVVGALLEALGERSSSAPPPMHNSLTKRERAVLKLVARGMSNKEIAAELDISPRTVQAHTIHVYDKLGIRTRAGAALRATELGLLGDP